MPNDLIPSSPLDEPAKAIQKASELGTSLVGAAEKGGGYLAGVFGTLPGDIVGMYADRMRHRRWMQYQRLARERDRLLDEWKVEDKRDAPIGIEGAIFEHALDETREQLFSLWARLLAAACDPARQNRIRKSYIEILRQFDPFDAVVFNSVASSFLLEHISLASPDAPLLFTQKTGLPKREVSISLRRLKDELLLIMDIHQQRANHNGQFYTGNFLFMTDVGESLGLILFEAPPPESSPASS